MQAGLAVTPLSLIASTHPTKNGCGCDGGPNPPEVPPTNIHPTPTYLNEKKEKEVEIEAIVFC